ncbi:hypothetical protein SeMB42_g00867 [Synchytrium endobioticum]|nr:hypothetical protein SeMB42_g00867 [Synchytrium endobioticum]
MSATAVPSSSTEPDPASPTVTTTILTEPSAIIISTPSTSLPSVTPATSLEPSVPSTSHSTTIRRGSGADVSDITGLMQQGQQDQLPGTPPAVRSTTSDIVTARVEESASSASAQALIQSERRLVFEARAKMEELETQLAEDITAQSRIASEWESRYRTLEVEYNAQMQKCEGEKQQIRAALSKEVEDKLKEISEKHQRDIEALQGDVEKALNERDRIMREKSDVCARLAEAETLKNTFLSTQADLETLQREVAGKDANIEELGRRLVKMEKQREDDVAETRRKWRDDVAALKEDFRNYKSQYTKIEEERDAFLAKLTELQLQRDGEREQWERRMSDFQKQLASLDEIKTHDTALAHSLHSIRNDRDHAIQVAEMAEKLLHQTSEDNKKFDATFSKISQIAPIMYEELFNKSRLMNIVDQAHADLNACLVRLEEVKAHRDKILEELESLAVVLGVEKVDVRGAGVVVGDRVKVKDGDVCPAGVTVTTSGPGQVVAFRTSELYKKQVATSEEKIRQLEAEVVKLEEEVAKLDRQGVDAAHAATKAHDNSVKLYKELEETARDRQRLRESLRSTQSELSQITTALNVITNRRSTPQLFRHVTHEIECLLSDIHRLQEVYFKISQVRTGTVAKSPPEIPRETTTITGKRRVVNTGAANVTSPAQNYETEDMSSDSPSIVTGSIRFRNDDNSIQSPLPSIVTRQYQGQQQQPRPSRERIRMVGTEVLGRPTAPRAYLAGEMVPIREYGGGKSMKIGLPDFSSA